MSDAYRIRSGATWALAREDYLAGMTAEEVCGRYDLGLSAFRARARREQWRRADAPDPTPDDSEPLPEGLGPSELAAVCLDRVARCIDRNRSAEAMRWLRLHMTLVAHAEAQRREPAPASGAPGEMHDVHSKKDARPVEPAPAPLNRSQRRRHAAQARAQGAAIGARAPSGSSP